METGPAEQFRRFLAEGKLMLQRSRSSGRFVHYPRIAEPGSGTSDLEWVEATGHGVVYSTTIVRPRPPAAPYAVVLVDLEEGPRMMASVEGCPPEAVTIGMKLLAAIADRDGMQTVIFRPA